MGPVPNRLQCGGTAAWAPLQASVLTCVGTARTDHVVFGLSIGFLFNISTFSASANTLSGLIY
jgi:hypothetical protein